MNSKKPIVVVGSINVDLVANAEHIPAPGETISGSSFQTHSGGKGANQAVAIARLGYPVSLIGCVGEDAFGTQLKASLAAESVDISTVETAGSTTGVAMITVSSKGENSIVVVPGANAAVTPQFLESKADLLRGAGVVLTQFEIPAATVEFLAEFSREEGVPLIVDPAPARDLSTRVLEQVEWFTPNETEAAFYLGADNGKLVGTDPVLAARLLVGKGAKGVVLKLGARGAQLASSTGLQAEILPIPVHTVDTTAAGDTFNGAFAAGLMLGMTPTESARFASRAAAISVSRPGAQPSMPRMHELEKLL